MTAGCNTKQLLMMMVKDDDLNVVKVTKKKSKQNYDT